eukprot:m51a1_g9414 putative rna pseudouridylate synthase domain-containing protein 2 (434) ;mRNA; r:347412-349077
MSEDDAAAAAAAAAEAPGSPEHKRQRTEAAEHPRYDRRERRKERRQRKRAARATAVASDGLVTSADLAEARYVFRGGLRCVEPYWYTFVVNAKERWVGRTVLDVFSGEFVSLEPTFFEKELQAGRIKVNGVQPKPDDAIALGDSIEHTVHRHEPPVSAKDVVVVADTEDLVAVDKPASLPVHPCGRYRHNTLMFVLASQHGLQSLHSVHRLDRLTSGIMLMAKSPQAATKYMKQIKDGLTRKEYLARVKGCFPEGETLVDQPILLQHFKLGLNSVSPQGKESKTLFNRLFYDAATDNSVVKCQPLTGRTHQIRIHLQWMGHPIVNDPIYNPELFEKRKSWLGPAAACEDGDPEDNYVPEAAGDDVPPQAAAAQEGSGSERPPWFEESCVECQRGWRDPQESDLVMWLHALRYSGPGWCYETAVPLWAVESAAP